MYISAVLAAFHFGITYLLIITAGLGVTGAAISLTITYGLNLACFLGYTYFSETTRKTIAPFTCDAFRDLGDILRFGIPSAAQMFFDWAAVEMLAILIGLHSVSELAASAITLLLLV